MAKTKKELGLDSMGVQKSMRTTDYLGDGLGQLPLNIMAGLGGQLTYFYTEKVGLAAGMVATMLLIAKIFDAFSDLIMGKIMDEGKSPKGKCRPWFLRMAIPAAVMIVLLFTVPKNAASGLQSAYVLITNILITAVVYTAVAIPYGALMAMRTESSEERGKMGVFRAAFGYIAGMVIAILLIPITNMLGGTQSAWIKVSVIFALISLLSLLVLYKVTKENAHIVEKSEDEDVTFGEGIKMLFKNKYWVIMLVLQFMMNISYGLSSSGGTYYAKYILGNDNIVALLGAVGLIPTFLGFALVGVMIKKLGVVGTLKFSFGIGIISNVLMIFLHNNFTAYMVLGCFTTFATIPMMCLVGVLTTMAIDFNEYKYGVKMVACSNSASSFGGKVGSGVGGSLIGWMLAAVGYDATLSVAPEATKMAIYGFSFIIPLIAFVVMFVLVSQFDLEKKLPQMREEVAKRKQETVTD